MPFVVLAVVILFSQALLEAEAPDQPSREDVRRAQQALKLEGFDPGPLDGIIGPLTRSAVKKFQKSNKIQVSGRLDRSTRDRLNEKLAKHAPSPPRNLKVLDVGEE